MVNLSDASRLSELPHRIYEARLEALAAEQRRIAAENHYSDLRNTQYLSATAHDQGHYQAQATAANAEEVLAARQQRDRYTIEAKRAQARYQRLRDEMTAQLQLAALSSVGGPSECP